MKFKPCLANIAYDSEKEVSQLPKTPIFSILQFIFRPDVDVLQPLQPVHSLWHNSLEYVSTIPGFQGLHWAPVNPSSTTRQFMVLIQWDSGLAWRRFECSTGFSMLLGYLSEFYNRCIQSFLPAGISESNTVLELVSYQFSPSLSLTSLRTTEREDYRRNFKEKWESAILPLVGMSPTDSKLLAAHGDWMQRDGPSEDQHFIGLLYWKSDTEVTGPRQLIEANINDITTHLRDLSKDAITVTSRLTAPLNYVSPEFISGKDSEPTSATSLSAFQHPILKSSVTRKYLQAQATSHDNPRGEAPERRLYGPTGRWYQMGLINQHDMPRSPQFPSIPTMEMITYRVKGNNSHVTRAFKDLRLKLWDMSRSELRWGVDNERAGWYTRHTLLFEFPDLSLNEGTRNKFRDIITEFTHQCGEAIDSFAHEKTCAVSQLDFLENIEIMTFNISANESDRRSFEYAYSNYLHTTTPRIMDGMSLTSTPAAQPRAHGWVFNQSPQSESDTVQFSSVFTWTSQAARQEWYNNYSKRALDDFDGLGHIIDWLRVLCKRVDTQFLLLEAEDRDITDEVVKSLLKRPRARGTPRPEQILTIW